MHHRKTSKTMVLPAAGLATVRKFEIELKNYNVANPSTLKVRFSGNIVTHFPAILKFPSKTGLPVKSSGKGIYVSL